MRWIHFQTQITTTMALVDDTGNTVQVQTLQQATGQAVPSEFAAAQRQLARWLQQANAELAAHDNGHQHEHLLEALDAYPAASA